MVLLFFLSHLWGQQASGPPNNYQLQTEELVRSCRQLTRPDEICRVLISARDISTDTLEAIKEFADLSPRQYAVLTLVNALANSRVRIRMKSPWHSTSYFTLDTRRDSSTFTLEYTF
ncbi:MAG: hypothetical protein WCH11_00460 [Bdellovibrio sp.]